ncbi:sulfite oxidase [Curvibacter sp. RS43]|uniref:SorT family sulfite dehydrogenase catalytic subunit n=1 Tax=Curvibacter microcysteis TaxID=3026419 RepID=UPI00235FA7BC|nr:sulfite oxidase [Curvibacter sp. RS43]MDD0811643.1 sulfite oxidase [Curvibacter sp. RS43]
MSDSPSTLSRRQWLGRGGAALAAWSLGAWTSPAFAQPRPLPAYAAWKDAPSLIVHSNTTMETRRGAFGTSVITPSNQLYIRNNLPPPEAAILAQRDEWVLELVGVAQARSLRLAELKTLGLETVATVLQCSGNGRAFFPGKPSGTPWTVGAAGCVVWSGVPVRNVVKALGGVQDGMKFLTGTGGEKLPEGIDPKSLVVERSVPLAALDDALLAWEMNGEPLSLAHGGPLRLIVPGYQGVNNIKYIQRLAFTARETDARIMAHGYRLTPPGQQPDPAQPSVWEMGVKSWINSPQPAQEPLAAGPVLIHGVAFGGVRGVQQVEVSVDGGKQWQPAELVGPDLGRFAWRQFAFKTTLASGTHLLVCRATDTAGQVQPQARVDNTGGYNNTSWLDHGVKVQVA